jgi:DNA polymerase-1
MLIQTMQDLKNAVKIADKSPSIAVDTETTGLDIKDDYIIGVSWATKEREWYVDIEGMVQSGEKRIPIFVALAPLFDTTRHRLIFHNAPFDLQMLRKEYVGVEIEGTEMASSYKNVWDTMSMAVLYDENLIGKGLTLEVKGKRKHVLSLKGLAHLFLGREPRSWDDALRNGPVEELAAYACDDARNTYDLAVVFSGLLSQEGLLNYYDKYLAPMCFVVERMEHLGMKIDVEKLKVAQEELEIKIHRLTEDLIEAVPPREEVHYSLKDSPLSRSDLLKHFEEHYPDCERTARGQPRITQDIIESTAQAHPEDAIWRQLMQIELVPFNPDSTRDLADYFISQGYSLPMTEKGHYSVTEEVISELYEKHPQDIVCGPLLKRRELSKLKSTYVDMMLRCAWPDGGYRAHPNWNHLGTVTGRMSCTSSNHPVHPRGPAGQTIPRPDTIMEKGMAYNPREWVIAEEGYTFLVADLSQAEVRMLACLSQDKNLMAIIKSGQDVHASMAQKSFPQAWEQADEGGRKILRSRAKQITFGLPYGISAYGLAPRLAVSEEEAQEFIDNYFAAFPQVQEFLEREKRNALRKGYVESYLGRRRRPIFVQQPPKLAHKATTEEGIWERRLNTIFNMEWDYYTKEMDVEDERSLQGRAGRQAVNFPIQGSVAELINFACVQLVRLGYRLILQMHDEIVLEVEDNPQAIEQGLAMMKQLLEVELNGVPFKLDCHVGKTWAAGKE